MNDELRQILAEYLRRQALMTTGGRPPVPPLPPKTVQSIPNGGFVDSVDRDIGNRDPNSNASNYSIQPGRSK
jgi:hypothetical protein